MKVILFGGTFDPIHLGHTKVSVSATEHIGADKTIFIPAKRSPLKSHQPHASTQDRFRMIALAIKGQDVLEVSDFELKKPAPSYTIETIRHFRGLFGEQTELYWLAGADALRDLARWYKAERIMDECNVAVMHRAGSKMPDFAAFEAVWGSWRAEKLRRNAVPTPLVDVSSSRIRRAVAAGRDITGMVHPAVAEYIQRRGLYR